MPRRGVFPSSGGVPHRIGDPVQGREGRAEAWEAKFPERDASVPRRTASQQAFRPKGAAIAVAVLEGGSPSQGPGDRTWSRQTSTPVRRRREATAREKPEKLIQGGRRTPNGDPIAEPNSMPAVWRRGPRLENGR